MIDKPYELGEGEFIEYEGVPDSLKGVTHESVWADEELEIAELTMHMTFWERVTGDRPFRCITKSSGGVLYYEHEWPFFHTKVTRRFKEDHWQVPIPWRFGLAFHDFDRDTFHYWIIPVNFIIALTRRVYFVFAWELPHEFRTWERRWRKEHKLSPFNDGAKGGSVGFDGSHDQTDAD